MEYNISTKLSEIAICIYDKILQKKELDGINGLYDGDFGVLLFLLYYSEYSQNEEYIALSESFSEKLLSELGSRTQLHSFCGGLAGILYLLDFLKKKELLDVDLEDVEKDLESYILTGMRRNISQNHYDFMHGALGVGLYFLKKQNNIEVILELIEYLHNTADKDVESGGYKWKSLIDIRENKIGYNIALSHGISSIILFLCRAISNGFNNDKTLSLLEGSVNFILSQEIDPDIYGCYFPSQSKEQISKSRLGWCYGDLGVAFAIWTAGKAIDRKDWVDKGLEVLRYSTQRLSPQEERVIDAPICHGSIGIAMIYRRMHIETQDDIFAQACNYWIQQTLNFALFEDGLAGYKAYETEGWKNYYCLLTGISGIGLFLTSYLQDDKQEWDEIFLLS